MLFFRNQSFSGKELLRCMSNYTQLNLAAFSLSIYSPNTHLCQASVNFSAGVSPLWRWCFALRGRGGAFHEMCMYPGMPTCASKLSGPLSSRWQPSPVTERASVLLMAEIKATLIHTVLSQTEGSSTSMLTPGGLHVVMSCRKRSWSPFSVQHAQQHRCNWGPWKPAASWKKDP